MFTARNKACPSLQQARQFEIGRSQFSAAVHHHHDCRGFIERHPRLAKNFSGNEILVLGKDAAGIDDAKIVAVPMDSPYRRSRVMPGSSPTMARRDPTSRLNSVDLPTLGRPTMAMRGLKIS